MEQVHADPTQPTPPSSPDEAGKLFLELVAIMARLRGEGGCPWDREQTHASLKKYLIEESYEVCQTIDEEDWQALPGELGDVLLQVVFHAQLGAEDGRFTVQDVIRRINEKLITRHPHVFGDEQLETSEQVLDQWELQKLKTEKSRTSILDGIPTALPAMLRAGRMQNRAKRVGFDWSNVHEVLAKVREELTELEDSLAADDQPGIREELGDLFFALVNLSRFLDLDAEDALQDANRKFQSRFQYIERTLASQGRDIHAASLAEMDVLWEQSKVLLTTPAS